MFLAIVLSFASSLAKILQLSKINEITICYFKYSLDSKSISSWILTFFISYFIHAHTYKLCLCMCSWKNKQSLHAYLRLRLAARRDFAAQIEHLHNDKVHIEWVDSPFNAC